MYLYIVYVGVFLWGGGSCPRYFVNYTDKIERCFDLLIWKKNTLYVKLLQKYRSRYVTNNECYLSSRWFKCQNKKLGGGVKTFIQISVIVLLFEFITRRFL